MKRDNNASVRVASWLPSTESESLLSFSGSAVSDSGDHGLQQARLSCPPLSPGVCSNSCPLSQWCHPTISFSVAPFSSCPQSFSASGSFPMSQLFASGGQSIGASASASVLPMNIQGWFYKCTTNALFIITPTSQAATSSGVFHQKPQRERGLVPRRSVLRGKERAGRTVQAFSPPGQLVYWQPSAHCTIFLVCKLTLFLIICFAVGSADLTSEGQSCICLNDQKQCTFYPQSPWLENYL